MNLDSTWGRGVCIYLSESGVFSTKLSSSLFSSKWHKRLLSEVSVLTSTFPNNESAWKTVATGSIWFPLQESMLSLSWGRLWFSALEDRPLSFRLPPSVTPMQMRWHGAGAHMPAAGWHLSWSLIILYRRRTDRSSTGCLLYTTSPGMT